MMENQNWLASMGNGVLGEARIKALLLNRFWVSTRSVDVNGADFLIELPSQRKFTDLLSPILGTVQVKFCTSDATTHYIPKEYVVDETGSPLEGFFVVVTVGHEDAVENFILTARELSQLPMGQGKSQEKFYLSSKHWRKTASRSSKYILDTLEKTLRDRSTQQTEKFLHSINVPDFTFSRTGMDDHWLLPIPNEFEFIPDAVYRIRSAVRADLYSFDEIMAAMQCILTSRDARIVVQGIKDIKNNPAIAFEDGTALLEQRLLARYHSSGVDLDSATKIHSQRLQFLEENSLLTHFIDAWQRVQGEHERFYDLHNNPDLVGDDATGYRPPDHYALTRVKFDPQSLMVTSVQTELHHAAIKPRVKAKHFSLGCHLYPFYLDYFQPSVWRQLHRLQVDILAHYYGLLNPADKVISPKHPILLNY